MCPYHITFGIWLCGCIFVWLRGLFPQIHVSTDHLPDVLVVLLLFIKPFHKHNCLLLRRRPWDRHCTIVAHRNMIHPQRPPRPPREHGGRGKVSSLGRWPRKADPEGPQVKHSGHLPKTAFLSYVWEFSLCRMGMWTWGWGWDSSPSGENPGIK